MSLKDKNVDKKRLKNPLNPFLISIFEHSLTDTIFRGAHRADDVFPIKISLFF